ncbi:MAG: alpha/beta fold hydrolase [Micropepsaceae bacterium]
MHIEVISKSISPVPGRPSLLFIHGGFHGAWCWDEYLLPWFAERGWETHALSLRGHGESDGRGKIRSWTLDDYTNDVETVLKQIGKPCVLIGHSLGGVIAQRCWDRVPAIAGMVLYASSPLRPDPAVIRKLLR